MTVELSWRYDAINGHPEDMTPSIRATDGTVIGRWVPDTRLQAIADAWNKSKELAPENGREFAQVIALLDALTEENKCNSISPETHQRCDLDKGHAKAHTHREGSYSSVSWPHTVGENNDDS